MSEINVCFVAHSAYGEMAGGRSGEIGGIQRQQSLMARWLARRGHRVTMLTHDEGQPAEQVIDGVAIHKLHRKEAGMPGLRFFHPRWTGLLSGLARADAQVYYHNNAEYITGQVALWCRANQRRFVFSTAHDWDCEPALVHLPSWRERRLYKYGLTRADRLISQTATQQRMLQDGFGLPSTVIAMPCPLSSLPPAGLECRAEPPRILWVGRIVENKRLELLLDVAEQAPELRFDVAGTPESGSSYGARVLQRAATLPNVQMRGRVARERMPALYRASLCLCCTATLEGFPNTFLEAWSEGTPIVSTFDPDSLIASRGLGVVGQTAAELLAGIRALTVPASWRGASERSRAHFVNTHDPEIVMPQFERVFAEAQALQRPGP
jgi:glycosyltransferase involved in cell wall biosynthesis